ncbi:MAG: hypothetical protein LBV69_08185 [Bacteroidales bacterium]|nr:hypothetical protein [Bacteroidales bacterium]
MNFILNKLQNCQKKIAVTSIGVDGEKIDIIKQTHKPEIFLIENTVFVTSEKHFREKKINAEILDISEQNTSLGRLVTAISKSKGKVILSGPTTTKWVKETISNMKLYNVDLTIIDGALSRKSFASPTITDAFILNTGAALSVNIPNLIKSTKFLLNLINIEQVNSTIFQKLTELNETKNGIWTVDNLLNINDLEIQSALLIDKFKEKFSNSYNYLYINGIITDKLLNFLRIQKDIGDKILIVNDFTKIFVESDNYYSFINRGGKINVLYKPNLIAVCVNPISPDGYKLNSKELTERMSQELNIKIYDIKKSENEI